jgi:endonuclease/exonuclease/phosphatase family metal-dependent hydrolase
MRRASGSAGDGGIALRTKRMHAVAGVLETTAVFLFFYQALRVLFSALFGLIYDALFAATASMTTVGVVLVVVILALLAPLAAPRRPGYNRVVRLLGAVVVLLARIPLTLNHPQIRLVASILIVAGAGLYLAARLRRDARDLARGLVLALVVDQLLRAAGYSWDVTLRPAWWIGQVLVSTLLCLLAGWLFRQRPGEGSGSRVRLGLWGGLGWGAWLFLETSLLAFPNAIARWSALPSAAWIATCLPLVTGVPLFLPGTRIRRSVRREQARGAAGLAILLLGLAGGYLLAGWIAAAALMLAQLAAVVLLETLFSEQPGTGDEGSGLWLAMGGLLFLVLSFGYAFTFTYAYTLDVFREMGLPLFLAAGLIAALPGLRRQPGTAAVPWPLAARGAMPVAILVGALVLGGALVPAGRPAPVESGRLQIITYNMHYGYDSDWHLSLEEQAQTIEASGAGMVMLQEVDTGRPTSYMIDDALWLSRRLDMQAVYLPTMEHLTGIALLSRYPVLDTETLLLPSELEQTGILWAELDTGGTPINAFAVWMGLEPAERARQLDAALPFIAAHPGPAVFGGDFNSTPDSPVYARIREAGFVDPFAALGLGSPPTDPAVNPEKRIDFVWLRSLTAVDAQVPDSLASDHRPVVVEASLP